MKSRLLILPLAIVIGISIVSSANALAPFKKEFQTKYIDDGGEDLKAAFKKSSCNTCHTKGKPKKIANLNAYGTELEKLVKGTAKTRIKTEKEDVLKEFKEALEEVAKKKNDDDETYGDRIKAGKLPVDLP